MKSLAFYSIKGGVGKTAMAVNIAYHTAVHLGLRTLLIDLDPQGSAGFYFRVHARSKAKAKDLFKGNKQLQKMIRESDFKNLDIIPAIQGFRNVDKYLASESHKKKQFDLLLEHFDDEYDRIIIDSPPHFGISSENIFLAADFIVVPVIPSILSQRTLEQLVEFFTLKGYKRDKIIAFFSMVDTRKKLHKETISILSAGPTPFLNTAIPYASAIEKMGIHRAPVCTFAAKQKAALAVHDLAEELERLEVI
ncbi:MAG: ParA family protein [Chitinispirillaceae bacterium]